MLFHDLIELTEGKRERGRERGKERERERERELPAYSGRARSSNEWLPGVLLTFIVFQRRIYGCQTLSGDTRLIKPPAPYHLIMADFWGMTAVGKL